MKFKKLLYALLLMLWAAGIIGGIGYTLYYGGYVIAAGIAVCVWMSWPRATEYFNILKQ